MRELDIVYADARYAEELSRNWFDGEVSRRSNETPLRYSFLTDSAV